MNGIGPLAFAPIATMGRINGYLRLALLGRAANKVILFIRGGRVI